MVLKGKQGGGCGCKSGKCSVKGPSKPPLHEGLADQEGIIAKAQELSVKTRMMGNLVREMNNLNHDIQRVAQELNACHINPLAEPGEAERLMEMDKQLWERKMEFSKEVERLRQECDSLSSQIKEGSGKVFLGILVKSVPHLHPQNHRLELQLVQRIGQLIQGLDEDEKAQVAGDLKAKASFWLSYYNNQNDLENVNVAYSGTDYDIGWSTAASVAVAYIKALAHLRPLSDEVLLKASIKSDGSIREAAAEALKD